MTSDAMRAALEAAKENLLFAIEQLVDDCDDDVKKDFRDNVQQIEEALKLEPAKYPLPQTLVDMDKYQLMEYAARLENQISEMTKLSEEGAEDEATQVRTESVIRHEQPYEISTKVGAEIDSKGQTKPNAEVKITRHLESDKELTELIRADLSRGVEECVVAIDEVLKRRSV